MEVEITTKRLTEVFNFANDIFDKTNYTLNDFVKDVGLGNNLIDPGKEVTE